MLAHFLQFFRFGIIGLIAAFTHYLIVILLIQPQHQIPLKYANLIAFLVAFWVSYFGHRIFTFKATHIKHRKALSKFAFTAGLGFILNESILLISHHYLNIQISILVIFSICLTSVFTFLLNRYFAFQH